jgi:hypothetical protein
MLPVPSMMRFHDIPVKLTLSYKLNSKSGKILLTASDSWFFLRDAVVTSLNDKKKTTTDAIDICLSPDNVSFSIYVDSAGDVLDILSVSCVPATPKKSQASKNFEEREALSEKCS